jgi:hypothetical protein
MIELVYVTMTADPQSAQRLEAGRALLQDDSTFIDFARSSIFLTEEHEIFDYTS